MDEFIRVYKNWTKGPCSQASFLAQTLSLQKQNIVFKQIETGVLGFQVMIVTVVKAFLEKQKPEIFLYMNPKYFCRFNFENELFQEQNKGYTIISNLEFFNQSVLSVLNKDARYQKNLSKPIKHIFLTRNPTQENEDSCNNERNYHLGKLSIEKKNFFGMFDTQRIAGIKTFGKTVNSMFSGNISKTKSEFQEMKFQET